VTGFGPHQELQLLALLVAAAALLVGSTYTGVPYPILLVLGGLVLGFVPGLPHLALPPDVVLIGILPPLLYVAAFNTGLRELRANLRPISALAVGLVTVTMLVVGVVGHEVLGLSWAAAFVLGAVVSPTDPIAALAISSRLGVPRRVLSLVEGESLVNDGTALVLYRVGVSAVLTGTFSFWHAALSLVVNIVGGIAVGLAIGVAIRELRRRLDYSPLEITIAFLTGYFAYLPASAVGVSGVLAVVTAGVFVGWYTPELTTPQTRMQGQAFWQITSFLLNALLFGLVGLQLPAIVDALQGPSLGLLAAKGALVTLVVILVRCAFVFPFTYLPHGLFRATWARDQRPQWQQPMLISWTGMRGVVTLAAALAIPLRTDSGAPFPHRNLIVFLSFAVVLGTLVGQGLTLPWLIQLLGLEDDRALERKEEAKARIRAAEAALARLEELADEDWVNPDTVERMRGQYQFRIDRFREPYKGGDGRIEERSQAYQRLRRELLEAERRAVIELRNGGDISDDVMRKVERDLDLEDSRLDI
jgi:CPA1 family monovalent cation:H+ antiporter